MSISVKAWTAIGAVAAVLGVMISLISFWPKIRVRIPWRKKRIFLSMPLFSISDF
jgi:hypothetical protein